MVRRLVPYGLGLAAIALAAVAGGVALLLRIDRVETYWLILVVTLGAIAWRYGRGPAIVATGAAAVMADYLFVGPPGAIGRPNTSEALREITGILASLAVIQLVYVNRRREILTEKRKDLLQDVSPRILQSLDADEIVNTVAEATRQVIDYQHFRLYRWDEGSERLILAKSMAGAEPYVDIDWHKITFMLGEGITGLAAQSRKPILVPDASRDSRMVYPPGTAPLEESVLSVPIITRDRLLGVLTLARLGARSLTIDDLRLMESIGAQTALALVNAEAYAEAQQTIKALAMIESLKAGDPGLTDADAYQRILEGLVEFSQAAIATLRLLREDGCYHLVAIGGEQRRRGVTAPMGGPLSPADVEWLADPRLGVFVADPRSDEKVPEWVRRDTQADGIKTSVLLPMHDGQRMVGLVGLHWRRPGWFRGEQLGRLQLLAAQAAIVLDSRQALERERSRAEALGELERARREFMQIASHELRTPLTVIRGYASMLEDGTLGQLPPAARQALKTLLDKSTEMRVQVERMLLLARLEDGATASQMSPLDLRHVITEAIDRVRPQVDLKHGELEVRLTAEPLPVVGDPERLGTAVDNLLQNAVKFSPGPPQIEVSGARDDGRVTVVVRDRGIGIPEEARSRLFEKFYRVNDPEIHNVAGTGIGLYLVRQVVEGHGGQINVDSQLGAGSAFKIELPAASEAT